MQRLTKPILTRIFQLAASHPDQFIKIVLPPSGTEGREEKILARATKQNLELFIPPHKSETPFEVYRFELEGRKLPEKMWRSLWTKQDLIT